MLKKMKVRAILHEVIKQNDLYVTTAGDAVPFGCSDCVDDIQYRIYDMTRVRNDCAGGTAARSHYSGVLAHLRKEKRAANKIYERDHADMSVSESRLRTLIVAIINEDNGGRYV